ncbi:MAG: hypothetical protein E7290_01410 [Lachnospiraceae bacterium]|nr:hypothetical protein [Lachnospiraceae bacterium]
MKELLELFDEMSTKEMTEAFNLLPVDKRIEFLNGITSDEKDAFIEKIRDQAVADFWTHEREAIENGTCTRDWTPEQIEVIMHISEKSGKELKNGAIAYFGEQAA